MSAAFGSGNTVGVGEAKRGGAFLPNNTTNIVQNVLLKIALPLLAVAYLLLDVEFFTSTPKGGTLFTRGGSSRHIMCDVGVP